MYNYPQMSAADSSSDKPVWLGKDEYCMNTAVFGLWSIFFRWKTGEGWRACVSCACMQNAQPPTPPVPFGNSLAGKSVQIFFNIYIYDEQSFSSNLQLHCVRLREESFSCSICNNIDILWKIRILPIGRLQKVWMQLDPYLQTGMMCRVQDGPGELLSGCSHLSSITKYWVLWTEFQTLDQKVQGESKRKEGFYQLSAAVFIIGIFAYTDVQVTLFESYFAVAKKN